MPLLLLNLLRQYWQLAVLCLLLAVIALQHLDLRHRKAEITRYIAANAMLEDANARLQKSVNSQNAAVTALQQDAQKKSRAVAEALQKVQTVAARYELHAQRIQALQQSGDECRDMKALIETYFK